MKKSTLVILGSFIFIMLLASTVMGQRTNLISLNSAGTESANNGSGDGYAVSPDGRFIAFASAASNLGPNDNNNLDDIYLRDTLTGGINLVSVNYAGTNGGNRGTSSVYAVSADGRYVTFSGNASDLVPNNYNGAWNNIFIRDMQTATTTLISVDPTGTASGNDNSGGGALSSDSRYVMFISTASNLVPNDNNSANDVFVRDLLSGTTTLVSVNSAETASGNLPSETARMSADGRYVVFESDATDLVSNDANGTVRDIFVRDMVAGTTTLVSVNRFGTVAGNGASSAATISADGRFVAFRSSASDLASNDNNGNLPDIYVRDLATNETKLVSVNWMGTGGSSGSMADPASAPTEGLSFSQASLTIWSPAITTRFKTSSCATVWPEQRHW